MKRRRVKYIVSLNIYSRLDQNYKYTIAFALSADGRTLLMSAGSDSAMRKWIDFLSKNGATLVVNNYDSLKIF